MLVTFPLAFPQISHLIVTLPPIPSLVPHGPSCLHTKSSLSSSAKPAPNSQTNGHFFLTTPKNVKKGPGVQTLESDLDSNSSSFKSKVLRIPSKPHGLTVQPHRGRASSVKGCLERMKSNSVLYCVLPICTVITGRIITRRIVGDYLASPLTGSKTNRYLSNSITLVFTFIHFTC